MSPLLSRGQVTFTTCYKKKAEFIVAFSEIKNPFRPYFRPQRCGLPLQRCYIVFFLFYNYDNDFNFLKSTSSSSKKWFNTGESAQQIEQATPVAEFRIQRYNSAIKNMGLRRILDFCEKYPVAFSIASQATCFVSGRTGTLKDEYFSVYVCENSTGSINFHYKSQDKKNKRSLRHQRNGKTVQCGQLRKNANCFKCGFHGICAKLWECPPALEVFLFFSKTIKNQHLTFSR